MLIRMGCLLAALGLALVHSSARAADPSTDAALEKAVRQLTTPTDRDPLAMWKAMPQKYKKDIIEIWTGVLEKMDEEMWDTSFAVMRKGTRLLKDKRDILVGEAGNLPGLPEGIQKEDIGEFYDAYVQALGIVFDSDLGKLANARKLKLEDFMSDMASKTNKQSAVIAKLTAKLPAQADQPMKFLQMPGATVISIKQDDDEAKVKLKSAKGDVFEVEFAKFDGTWFPKEAGDAMEGSLPSAKEVVSGLSPEAIGLFKPQIMDGLKKADKALDKLAKAQSAKELKDIVQQLMGGFGND
jgi:hypothetical protein